MFDGLTWGAILEQWPFGAAAAVLVIAVGMLIAVSQSLTPRKLPIPSPMGKTGD